jgi:CysZ protein
MFEGIGAVFGGIWFVIVTPRIWGHALVPALMLILLGCGLSALGWWGAGAICDASIGEPETFWGHVWYWTVWTLLMLTFVSFGIVVAVVLAQPLSGFALEAVSLAQERALLGENLPRSSFLAALWTSTQATFIMLLAGGIINLALFTIDFFFPPATVFTAPVQFVATGWLLAWNFLDYPLSLRGLGVIARVRWSWQHFEEFTVFGVLWALLLFVPGLFFLILPMGVAGATRLVILGEAREEMEMEETSLAVSRQPTPPDAAAP